MNLENRPCSQTAELHRIVFSVPAIHTFDFVGSDAADASNVYLRISCTLFDQESGQFIGRTCQPKGIIMVSKS